MYLNKYSLNKITSFTIINSSMRITTLTYKRYIFNNIEST